MSSTLQNGTKNGDSQACFDECSLPISIIPLIQTAAHRKKLLAYGYVKIQCEYIIPNDVILLIALWIWSGDKFDEEMSDKKIIFGKFCTFETVQTPSDTDDWVVYRSAVGTDIIQKGMRQIWKFQILKGCPLPTIVIGIFEDDMIKAIKDKNHDEIIIGSYYRDLGINSGYGLSLHSNRIIHDDDVRDFGYGRRFDIRDMDTFEMNVDMTGKDGVGGILSFVINAKEKKGFEGSEDSGYGDNVAFNGIDIEKRYRMTLALYYRKRLSDIGMIDHVAMLPSI